MIKVYTEMYSFEDVRQHSEMEDGRPGLSRFPGGCGHAHAKRLPPPACIGDRRRFVVDSVIPGRNLPTTTPLLLTIFAFATGPGSLVVR